MQQASVLFLLFLIYMWTVNGTNFGRNEKKHIQYVGSNKADKDNLILNDTFYFNDQINKNNGFESNNIKSLDESIFNEQFRATHRTEKSLLPFYTHIVTSPDGPEGWSQIASPCGGKSQSPIALDTITGINILTSKPLKLSNLFTLPISIRIENDGHTVKFIPHYEKMHHPVMTGGPLCCDYILDHFHFHWGNRNQVGSEHTLNNRHFGMEGHFVMYNSKYASVQKAMNDPKGLAVLGVFYQIVNHSINRPKFLSKRLNRVIEANSSYTLGPDESFSIGNLIGNEKFNCISYSGSLTTPPCSESVTWHVSTRVIQIEASEMIEFRKLKDNQGRPLVDNFRPIQQRHFRPIYFYDNQQL